MQHENKQTLLLSPTAATCGLSNGQLACMHTSEGVLALAAVPSAAEKTCSTAKDLLTCMSS